MPTRIARKTNAVMIIIFFIIKIPIKKTFLQITIQTRQIISLLHSINYDTFIMRSFGFLCIMEGIHKLILQV